MSFSKKIIAICIALFCISPAFSQSGIIHAEEAIGKIRGNETASIFKKIDAVKNIDKAKAATLKKSVSAQLKIFFSHPFLNPPHGFDVKTSFGVANDPFAKLVSFPACGLEFTFFYLDKDAKTGGIKESMDGTSIGITTNDENHFFRQVGNFWEDCSHAKFPLFFEQLPVSDSTADYIELNFRNYGYPAIAPKKPFRIIKRNDRPLFVPLTRKEFVQFLIAQKKYQIGEDEKTIKDIEQSRKQSEETVKNPPSYMTAEVLKALSDGLITMEKQITSLKESIAGKQDKIRQYQNTINKMIPADAASPARVDYNKKITDSDKLKYLVPTGRMEGVGLYKINPGYYDHSPHASGAQLIFVYYNIPNTSIFEKTEFNYLEQKTIDIFNQVDYQRLKETMN